MLKRRGRAESILLPAACFVILGDFSSKERVVAADRELAARLEPWIDEVEANGFRRWRGNTQEALAAVIGHIHAAEAATVGLAGQARRLPGRGITVRSSARDVHTRAKRTRPGWPLTVRRARTPLRRRSGSKLAAGEDGRVERARATFRPPSAASSPST